MNDYYKILGVSQQATDKEIKSAYRKLAKKYHPDVVKDNPELTKKMYEIQAAYQVIGNEKKRSEYDESRRNSQAGKGRKPGTTGDSSQGTEPSAPDMSQFERFFGFQPGKGMETYKDPKQKGKKPEGPIKPEEMFAVFFGTGKK